MSQADEESNRPIKQDISGFNAEGTSQSVNEASAFIARETRRRKRLLKFYLALLAVPVALGIAVLIFGRSDSRLVMDEIKTQAPPIVQREVGEQLKPTIKSEVQTEVGEQLRPTVKSEVETQVNPALGMIDDLRKEQAQLKQADESLKASQENAVRTIKNESGESVRSQLAELGVPAINNRLGKLEGQNLDARLRKLEGMVEKLMNQPRGNTQGTPGRRNPPLTHVEKEPQVEKTPQ
jgi:hypothetical protein